MRYDPRFPWHRVKRGGYFFVPTLSVQQVVMQGQQQAYRRGIYGVRCYPCIYKGMLGVMFRKY